jgi:hypothetical protein
MARIRVDSNYIDSLEEQVRRLKEKKRRAQEELIALKTKDKFHSLKNLFSANKLEKMYPSRFSIMREQETK